jgi:hypothetical protein
LRAEFTGGTDKQGATFTTSNPLAQLAIERSVMFNDGVKLIRTIDKDSVNTDTIKKPLPLTAYEDEEEVHEEVTELNEVVEILKSKGVKMSELKSSDKIKKVAEQYKLQFPNVFK